MRAFRALVATLILPGLVTTGLVGFWIVTMFGAMGQMGGAGTTLSKVQQIFDENNVAIVMDDESVVGLISKIDVVGFLTARSGW